MSAARWDRLVATLAEKAGVDTKVHTRSYPGGTSYGVLIRAENGNVIEVRDKWWRKNADVWVGWQVHAEGRDSIVIREWPVTKKRGDVAAHVKEALAL